ncbi:class I SAM-dependent methyltransferase [Glycomyces tarimensis]
MSPVKTLDDLRRIWDKRADSYDRSMSWAERKLFEDTRAWIAGRASGRTLEVAIGTGLNLEHYPKGLRLTGIDLSPRMLDIARRRARTLGIDAELRVGDAQRLEFDDASFDTVTCTFSLCGVPDDAEGVAEMVRVLRPGGRLLLADHVIGGPLWLRAAQRLIELGSVPFEGEHFRRRPLRHVEAAGLPLEEHDRFKKGMIERLAARKPA